MPATDRELAERIQSGNQSAFAELIQLHQRAVFNVAYRFLGNTHDAEDAAQEAFLRAWKFFARFDKEKPLAPWLKRITVNVCLNRIESTRPLLPLAEGGLEPAETSPGPEALAAHKDSERRIRSELATLPSRYRAVIELRHYQELSYEEIAETLNRPLSDVKSDLFRARKILAERLKDLRP